MKNLLIYGAGKNGKYVWDRCRQDSEFNIVGFADSHKTGSYLGQPILDLRKAAVMYDNLTVVITPYYFIWVNEIFQMLKENGFDEIYWLETCRMGLMVVTEKKDFLEHECISLSGLTKEDVILPYVEMHVMDSCNLNCKGCTHFSPIFEACTPDINERIEDIKTLSGLARVLSFRIMGGEPFLNIQIKEYVKAIRQLLPKADIHIATNGLLIPYLQDDILFCLQENEVIVDISVYEPTACILDKIKSKLESHHLLYCLEENKMKFSKPLSLSKYSIHPFKCISQGCVNLWNGKISRCPTVMYVKKLNKKYSVSLPEEGAYKLKEIKEGKELLALLKNEVPLCKHCIDYEIEWSRCGKEPVLTDFVVED